MILTRRSAGSEPNTALAAVKWLAPLATALVAAMFVFGFAPTAQSSVLPSANTGVAKVQDRSHDNDNPDATLYAHYEVFNTGSAALQLSSLTMRYWFTNENASDPLVFECDYALMGCSNLTFKFVTMASPVAGKANTILEIGFKSGSLAAGQNTGEIQTRVHHARFSNFNTTLTYSFIADPSFVYKDTQTVTLYNNGALIWGVEPR